MPHSDPEAARASQPELREIYCQRAGQRGPDEGER